ncbi:DUF47 domain-containing protein [Clostridium perfringens]|uniref:DUF47 domain-containing protein n=1 Tax=Clostridium perfringens TaxID=1502 RepID=UPI000DF0F22A|nr:DUF47 family protein [Clostridium perfringens]STB42282.1 pit accessory protein [Clostridium perfringens]
MFNLNPKDDKFYDMFIDEAKNVEKAAVILSEALGDLENKTSHVARVEELEHKGDEIVHRLIEELNNSFITPIDREDIFSITKRMDDILDSIESTMHRFTMFNINESKEGAKVLGSLIVDVSRELVSLMEEFKHMKKKNKEITERVISINKIENKGDIFYRQMISELFAEDGKTPVLDIIKWREIYKFLEATLDSCEAVANIVEGVVMKYV